jgi:hypothetical protein
MATNDQSLPKGIEATKNLRMNSKMSLPGHVVSFQIADAARPGDLSISRNDVRCPNTGFHCCSEEDEDEAIINLSQDFSKVRLGNHNTISRRNEIINSSSSQKTIRLLISTGMRSLDDIIAELRNVECSSWNCNDDSCENSSVDSLQYYKMRAKRAFVSKEG